jgi:hypothetical protein
MPLYEVLETSYIGERLVQAGSIIEYTPPPAPRKPPPGASEEEKSKPHYQPTTIGPNLRLAPKDSEPRDIPAEVVTRTTG